MDLKKAFRLAVDNVARYGDTDVFPFPIENHVFHDRPADVVRILLDLEKNFQNALQSNPPLTDGGMQAVGYTGFRWATQIDPLWNAFLLGHVVAIGEHIEAARIPVDRENIFSYRFMPVPADGSIFNPAIGWREFQQRSLVKCRKYSHVLKTDISNFYTRVYHHRLENALKHASPGNSSISRIRDILISLAGGVSYGIPVGGPAARLLCELLLNRVDRLLVAENIDFCRFADDYHVFANSKEEAYQALVFLNEKLLENEGLSLQKSKTRILSSYEFAAESEAQAENQPETEPQRFLSLRLHYDQYSETAIADYEKLKFELSTFDVVGMLSRELKKSRLHQSLVKKLVIAIKSLNDSQQELAVAALIDNIHILYPVLSSVLVVLKAVVGDISEALRSRAYQQIRDLIATNSYTIRVPIHLAYAIRFLADDLAEETERVLHSVYKKTDKPLIKRNLILIMGRRDSVYWLSDVRKTFLTMRPWEQRAMLICSYLLSDEGAHWRTQVKKGLSQFDILVLNWAADKSKLANWRIPI